MAMLLGSVCGVGLVLWSLCCKYTPPPADVQLTINALQLLTGAIVEHSLCQSWQSLSRLFFLQVQLRHNKRKSEAIKELLGGCGVRTNHQHDHDADGDDAEGEDDGRHDDCGLSSVSESAASGIEEAASLIRELAAATGTADD